MTTNCDTTKIWTDILCCPGCHGPLESKAHDLPDSPCLRCSKCKAKFHGVADSFDLTITEAEGERERDYYQKRYSSHLASRTADFDPERWSRRWADPGRPECRRILDKLGDLNGKVVVCLGNGGSTKEFHFLTLGARLICSDLSMSGVLAAKSKCNLRELASRAAFYAMDACKLPLKNQSADVVYGYEFVHHLPDLDAFFREVHRVLKPGGLCVFFDAAYSPIWQAAKKTVFWPVKQVSYLCRRRSPEDVRASNEGGYKQCLLEDLGARHGFSQGFYEPVMFFQHLSRQAVGSLLGWKLPPVCYRIPSTVGRVMDRILTERLDFLRRSKTQLVWGFRS